ncbi:MAG: hypothetical protein ACOC0E_05735, partial [Spirochaetota bacterium]
KRIPESIRRVWLSQLETPPVRWRKPQKVSGPVPTQYAMLDLQLAEAARSVTLQEVPRSPSPTAGSCPT